MAKNNPHVVIIGGGFGGIKCAKALAGENVDITLMDRHNYHLFQPLLYQLSTSMLAPEEIAYPIRNFFRDNKNVDLFMAKVSGIDQEQKVIKTNHGDVPYDYCVIAAGATTNFFGNKEVEEHSYGMKTVQEALHIRNHVLHMFERANREPDPEERQRMLTFVVVGGGPTGIEEAGALMELVNIQKKEFHHLDFSEVKVILLEATDKVLPMMPEKLRNETVRVLKSKGVDVRLGAMVTSNDGNRLLLKDGTVIPTKTVIWGAGVMAVPFVANCGGEVDRSGRIIVDEFLRVKGSETLYAIGDCANYMHGDMERPLPTVAPVATQEAVVAAHNIAKSIKGDKNLEPLHYKDLGAMATIGRGDAVMFWNGHTASGFFAWCAWLFVHLLRLAGPYTNFTVAVKWFWNWMLGVRLGRIITNISLDPER